MNKWKKLVKEREISPERGMGETGTARQIMEKTGVSCAAVPRFYHMDSVLLVIKRVCYLTQGHSITENAGYFNKEHVNFLSVLGP